MNTRLYLSSIANSLTQKKRKNPFLVLFFLVFISYSQHANAQSNPRENTIKSRLFPTYNSDFSYFFLRKDMRLYEQMTGAEVIAHEDGAVDIRTKGFLPIHNSEKWTYIIPFYFDQYHFVADETADELKVNNLFGQSALTYRPNKNWDFLHIIEFRLKGAENHFMKKEGNFFAQFMTARYRFNSSISLTGGLLAGIGWDHESDSYFDVKPALMLNWTPNDYLSIMVGVPGAAIEWSAPGGIDLIVHTLLDGGELNTTAAIRKNLGKTFDITFRYLKEGYDELYTPNKAASFVNQLDIKQINQYQDKYQVELTYRPEQNTIIQLIGGYSTNRDLNVTTIDDIESKFTSTSGYYLGINIARAILLN